MAPTAGALNRLRSDHRLAERYRAGDDGAFAVLYERHRRLLLTICFGVLGSYEDAQDALQNGLASASASLRDSVPDDVRAWLARVARNAAIDFLRARRAASPLDADEPALEAGPAGRAEEREALAELVRSLQQLPEHQRVALVMRELAGSSYAEVAGALDVDETAVRGLIARARLSLRAELEAGELACATVRDDLAHQPDGRRRPAIVRRHLRACEGCREFDRAMRADANALRGLAPPAGIGVLGVLSVLRLGRPVALGGVVAQGFAGAQVLKTVVACAVCLTAAGGVRELTVAPAERPRTPEQSAPRATPAATGDAAARTGAATLAGPSARDDRRAGEPRSEVAEPGRRSERAAASPDRDSRRHGYESFGDGGRRPGGLGGAERRHEGAGRREHRVDDGDGYRAPAFGDGGHHQPGGSLEPPGTGTASYEPAPAPEAPPPDGSAQSTSGV